MDNRQTPSLLEQSTMMAAMNEERDQKATMKRAFNAYYGQFPNPLKLRPGAPNHNVKVNKIRPVVDASVLFLFGTPPDWEMPKPAQSIDPAPDGSVPDEDPDVEPPEEIWLRECLRVNQWDALLLDLGINGGVGGTPYLRIEPSDPIPNPGEGPDFPRLQVLDPTCMTIRTDPRDITKVTAYIWQLVNPYDPATGKPRTERQLIERDPGGQSWTIKDQHANLQGGEWITDNTTVWPHSWSPVAHCKNLPAPNQVYGQPDVTDSLIGLNKARNANLTNRSKVEFHHGHPKVWTKGMDGRAIDSSPESVIDLPDDGEIGQLVPETNGEAGASLGRELDEQICEESGTPSIVLGRADQQLDPSGVALKVKTWPLTMKTEAKRKLYGHFLVEVCRRLLDWANYGPYHVITLNWPELLPVDPVQERAVLEADDRMGIAGKPTLSKKAGYDWDHEKVDIEAHSQAVADAALKAFDRGGGSTPVYGPNGAGGSSGARDGSTTTSADNGAKGAL